MTFAPTAQGFAPTGRYFEIAEGYYKWRAGEAYKFLEWGGVAIRVIGTEMKDIVVCSLDQVREISKEEYNRVLEPTNAYPKHWNPNKPINEK